MQWYICNFLSALSSLSFGFFSLSISSQFPIAVSSPRERSGDDRRLPSSAGSGEPAPPSSKESSLLPPVPPPRAAAPASPAPKGINVPARPRPAGLLPFASLCSRYDHRPPALVRHPPPVRRLLGPLSKPDPPLPPPQRHLPPPHPTPSLFLPSRPLPLTSPSPRSRSFRLSLPDFPLSVANRGAEPLPSFALPSAQSTERQRVEEPPRQGTTATARQTPRRHRPLAPGSHDP
uniref:Uncharacterized protein n=1 Tax=Oryza rufipogon TaxID=4529 RepID=A0A0E0NE10_ORYRU